MTEVRIVVADRGFVWVGEFSYTKEFGALNVRLKNGYNIREWGTDRGLGQLASTGPTDTTTLDPVADIIVPTRAVIAMLPVDEEAFKTLWNYPDGKGGAE